MLRTITATVTVSVSIDQSRLKALRFQKAQRLSAGTGAIRSVSTDRERVRIMEESQNGYEGCGAGVRAGQLSEMTNLGWINFLFCKLLRPLVILSQEIRLVILLANAHLHSEAL